MQTQTSIRQELRADIDSCGYFPNLVEDGVLLTAGDEEIRNFVVHHEPTFDRDEIHRHLTVMLLTPTRVIVGHTDDHPAVEGDHRSYAASSAESIAIGRLNAVVLTRVVPDPENFASGESPIEETWLSLGWGAMGRLELEPATCGDPSCEADHGFSGSMVTDDLTIRMSRAGDGAERVQRLVRFATDLQQAAGL